MALVLQDLQERGLIAQSTAGEGSRKATLWSMADEKHEKHEKASKSQ
jgi:hypothetical protein